MAITCKKASAKPAAATPATLYTVPADKQFQGMLSICNKSSSEETIRVALVNGGDLSPLTSDYIFYDSIIPANGYFRDSGICLNETDYIVVYSTGGNAAFLVTGLEVE